MDYRKFLGQKTTLVLPYMGGTSVVAKERRVRVTPPLEEGWWSFDIEGRQATARERVDAPELSHLPRVRGHFVEGWLFPSGARAERLALLTEMEPPQLSPCSARRWYGGELLFEALEFEQEAEEGARQALEESCSIETLKGVPASLRAAFGFALLRKVSRDVGTPVSPCEVMSRLREVADAGVPLAQALLAQLAERRQMEAHRLATWRGERAVRVDPQSRQARRARRRQSAEQRAAAALEHVEAELLSSRHLEDGQLEVTFRFMGERFISVVEASTLRIVDAGICLSGADRVVNLDSLPAVIREGIDSGELYITRH